MHGFKQSCLEKNNFLLLAQLKTVFGKYYVQVFKKIILESPSVINMLSVISFLFNIFRKSNLVYKMLPKWSWIKNSF